MDTISVSAKNNPLDIYRATTPRIWEIINTAVTLRFDFEKKEAFGEASLVVLPYANPVDTLTLDAKSMEIKFVGVRDKTTGTNTALPYRYDGLQLKISVRNLDFGNLITRRDQLFRIDYTAKPYAASIGGSAAISEDRGLYFINTDRAIPGKPVQIWTQGETESNSHWMPTIDKPNQRSTFSITLIVPDSMQTLSNGQLIASTRLGDGLRKDQWSMTEPIQVYAAMFAVGRFEIAKEEWKDERGVGHEVSYYTEPAYAPYARGMFKNTPEMMTVFSKATGVSYPWSKYSQIVVRDYVSGAMENTTASLFGEFTNKNGRQLLDENNEDVVSHELFHQWFGDYVTAESWSNLTLNESFATYGTLIWRRHKYDQASADEQAYSDLLTYLAAAQRNDPPLVRYHYRDREEMFDRISYQKGAVILRYINSLVGDTLFSQAMLRYLTNNRLSSAEASQWRLALEAATGKDWTQFFNQWYYRGGHPVLTVRYDYDKANKRMTVTARQKSSPDSTLRYNLQFKTAIIYDSVNRRAEDWTITERSQSFSYAADAQGKYPLVIPDVAHVVPALFKEENKPLEDWGRQLALSTDYISKRRAIDAMFDNTTDRNFVPFVAAALNDKTRFVALYTMQRLAGITKTSLRDELIPQVKFILQTSGNNKVRATALSVLGGWRDRSEMATMVAATKDSSYYMAGLALQALTNINPDTAYVIANEVLRHDPKSALQNAAWTAIVSKGAPGDMLRFQNAAPRVYGLEKVALAENLKRYAIATTNDSLYERSLALLAQMAKDESIRGYRFSIGSNAFELRDEYGKKGGSRRKALAEKYASQILASENDPDNIARYKAIGQ